VLLSSSVIALSTLEIYIFICTSHGTVTFVGSRLWSVEAASPDNVTQLTNNSNRIYILRAFYSGTIYNIVAVIHPKSGFYLLSS
jgi:hypothetical protein